jgi:DNA-binding response OmpR family regulator
MTSTPLVVLVDERLPGLAGTKVVETYLQASSPTSRGEFILLTKSPEQVHTSLNGRLPVVEKPFHIEALLAAVAAAAARLNAR